MEVLEPPFVMDVERAENWLIRITMWPPAAESNWQDSVHNHFGYIVTTALTASAYVEHVFASFRHRRAEQRVLRRGVVHLIEPSTIHQICLPAAWGVSLSLRTRSVQRQARERDQPTGKVRTRTRAADDYKLFAMKMLSHLGGGA